MVRIPGKNYFPDGLVVKAQVCQGGRCRSIPSGQHSGLLMKGHRFILGQEAKGPHGSAKKLKQYQILSRKSFRTANSKKKKKNCTFT